MEVKDKIQNKEKYVATDSNLYIRIRASDILLLFDLFSIYQRGTRYYLKNKQKILPDAIIELLTQDLLV